MGLSMFGHHSVQRVVALQPSATVILQAIGKLDRLVACTKYCVEVCPQAAGRTMVEDSWTAKRDEIVAVHPDLVIAAVPYQEKSVSEILRSGARFLGLAPRTLADIYTDIATIAGMLGVAERGQQVIAAMQREIENVRRQTSGLSRPRVFCEEWGKPLIASQEWVEELVVAAGGQFVSTPGRRLSPEDIVREDPDILIAAWCGAGERVPLGTIVALRKWGWLRAVSTGRVYCIRDEFLNTPAPTLLAGLHALAAAIHPECFSCPEGLRCISDVPSLSPTGNPALV
jgi:iron complex transport system substrate-binding protein